MPNQVEFLDSLFVKIKAILEKCEDTVKSEVEDVLNVANRITKTVNEQINNIHTSIDEFATKLEKAEGDAKELAARLVLELNLEIALLQAQVQKIVDELKPTVTAQNSPPKCCCSKSC